MLWVCRPVTFEWLDRFWSLDARWKDIDLDYQMKCSTNFISSDFWNIFLKFKIWPTSWPVLSNFEPMVENEYFFVWNGLSSVWNLQLTMPESTAFENLITIMMILAMSCNGIIWVNRPAGLFDWFNAIRLFPLRLHEIIGLRQQATDNGRAQDHYWTRKCWNIGSNVWKIGQNWVQRVHFVERVHGGHSNEIEFHT